MGLDITAYSNIQQATVVPDADGYAGPQVLHIHDAVLVWINKEFPGRANGLVPGYYRFDNRIDFRAGSYGGYNEWRDRLAQLVGWRSAKDCWDTKIVKSGPFHELINFADNEGYISHETATKLAVDFAEFGAEANATQDEYFVELYHRWWQACILASRNGVIELH